MFVASSWHKRGVFLLLISFLLAVTSYAMDAPETVEINALAKYYEPVEFNHQLHVDLAADCSVCHHHTTGTGTTDLYCGKCHGQFEELVTVSCADCHSAEPFSAESIHRQSQQDLFHVDMNGLKGAYHQNCLGCHKEMDGPTGCQDCHARTELGDEFYHTGKFAPKVSAHAASH
jgi:hypothetical protein